MLPRAPTAGAALGVATRFFSPTLLNHSIRCYLWGAMYGAAHQIAFDDELFYVSALLHDIGLTEAFDNHWRPFEEAGGNLAWVFGVAAGWPAEQADRAAEIIVLHMGDDVSRDADPKARLLQIATSFDVTGRWAEEFPPDARTEVLVRYPRLGFSAELLAEFEDQARRKPSSACATSIGAVTSCREASNDVTVRGSAVVRPRNRRRRVRRSTPGRTATERIQGLPTSLSMRVPGAPAAQTQAKVATTTCHSSPDAGTPPSGLVCHSQICG